MKKQLLLCACVAVSSLLASNLEESQQPFRSAQTTINDLPMEMQFHIAEQLHSLQDFKNLSQVSKNFQLAAIETLKRKTISQLQDFVGIFLVNSEIYNFRIDVIIENNYTNDNDFLNSLNVADDTVKANLKEILQKFPSASPMKILSLLPALVKNASGLKSLEIYSKFNANPSLEFIMASATLCQGIENGYARVAIIKVLANLPAEKINKGLVNAAETLCQGITNGYTRAKIIEALAIVPAVNYEAFISASQTLCQRIASGYDRVKIVEALANGPAVNYESLISASQTLCQGITNGESRAMIIIALANGPAGNYDEFTSAATTLCQGIANGYAIIKTLVRVPAESYATCINGVQQANTHNIDTIIKIMRRFRAQ